MTKTSMNFYFSRTALTCSTFLLCSSFMLSSAASAGGDDDFDFVDENAAVHELVSDLPAITELSTDIPLIDLGDDLVLQPIEQSPALSTTSITDTTLVTPILPHVNSADGFKFPICSVISIPTLQVSETPSLVPTSNTITSSRMQYFIDAIITSAEKRRDIVAMSASRQRFSSVSVSAGSLINELSRLSAVSSTATSNEYICSALLPSAAEIVFAPSEAAGFYYELATILYRDKKYTLATDAISAALAYKESTSYYHMCSLIAKTIGDLEMDIETRTSLANYVLRTQGPLAATLIIEEALLAHPHNDALQSYATKLLLSIAPEEADVFLKYKTVNN